MCFVLHKEKFLSQFIFFFVCLLLRQIFFSFWYINNTTKKKKKKKKKKCKIFNGKLHFIFGNFLIWKVVVIIFYSNFSSSFLLALVYLKFLFTRTYKSFVALTCDLFLCSRNTSPSVLYITGLNDTYFGLSFIYCVFSFSLRFFLIILTMWFRFLSL